MSRDYYGDISGKFYYEFQESNDIENLINISCENEYIWYCCNCDIDENELGKESFCKHCYSSYEEHFQQVKEYYEWDKENLNGRLYLKLPYLNYTILKTEHYESLLEKIEELKLILPPMVIKEFDKIEENEEILDGYSIIFNQAYVELDKFKENIDYNQLLIYFGRYKIGLQIKYVLDKEESCNVSCEI